MRWPIARITWAQRGATRAAQRRRWTGLFVEIDWERPDATFPFGAHVAVVEIDRDTGRVTLIDHTAVDDCGTIINPLLADGQVHGGIAQGAAQALLEEVVYDETGNLLTSNLADYAFVSAAELPSFTLDHTVTLTHINPLGAKGIGESGTIGSTERCTTPYSTQLRISVCATCMRACREGMRSITVAATTVACGCGAVTDP